MQTYVQLGRYTVTIQGFHYVFVQEVSGVFQPGISSFSYEKK